MKTTHYNSQDLWHLRLLIKYGYKNTIHSEHAKMIIKIYLIGSNNNANRCYFKFEYQDKQSRTVMPTHNRYIFISLSDYTKMKKKLIK